MRFAELTLCLAALTGVSACRTEAVKDGIPRSTPGTASAAGWTPLEGRELIGTPAPELRDLVFVQGEPQSLAALKGKLVLIRFWLVECPYCKATAPALNELHRRYASRGLVVLGIHHPKREASRSLAHVGRAARALGFEFLVAHDDAWATARAFGVGSTFKRFTSVTLLVDRDGKIAWVHDGGEFHAGGGSGHEACRRALQALEREIERRM
jgi:thiol-disulfide isomerase/thioredoxin